jgi:hypothetical protein
MKTYGGMKEIAPPYLTSALDGLGDLGVGVRVPVGSRISLLEVVHTGSEVHPTSYPIGTGGSFPGGKAAGA